MKNLNREDRRRYWHAIHKKGLERRRARSRHQSIRKTSGTKSTDGTRKIIECPSDFSLDTNFEGVTTVLHAIRSQSRRQRNEYFYVDFRPIRKLSPAAALVLAAELDRWNHVLWRRGQGHRLQARDVTEWDPVVRRLLGDMGLFDLLKTTNPIMEEENDTDTQYVRFRTGDWVQGAAIDALRKQDLEPLVGEVPSKARLYGAVTEAMTNVVQHAYDGQTIRPNWWLSASHTATGNELVILLFDQGVGIPNTLSRNFPEWVKMTIKAETDHAEIIQKAHDLSRSASMQKNRGNGLKTDMLEYLNRLPGHGSYGVISLRGQYIFEKQTNGKTSERLKNHEQELHGTLIEWRLHLQ